MGIRERKIREKEQLRQQILDAARELFFEEGYGNVSMRKVAEKIEYSPTTIYLYFKNKTDLLIAISENILNDLLDTLQALSEDSRDPLRNLRSSAKAYAEFGLSHPKDFELIFIIRPQYQEGLRLTEGSAGERAFRYLRTMVSACVRQNKFRQADVETTAQALWSAMHGVTSLLIAYPDFPWIEKEALIDMTIDTMLEGLKA